MRVISRRSHSSNAARSSEPSGPILSSSALSVASTRRAIEAPSAQPTSRPPCSRTRSSIASRSASSRPASTVLIWPSMKPNTSWCRPPATRLCSARATTAPAPGPPRMRGTIRATTGARARPPRWPAGAAAWRRAPPRPGGWRPDRPGSGAGWPAGRADAARRRPPPAVNTWVATKRPSARPSRAFCAGMMAVCGIGMPSGWRNSAVTANQSAMPPTKPGLGGGVQQIGRVARRPAHSCPASAPPSARAGRWRRRGAGPARGVRRGPGRNRSCGQCHRGKRGRAHARPGRAAGQSGKQKQAGASPRTPPRGAAPWNPAKGSPLEPFTGRVGRGRGRVGEAPVFRPARPDEHRCLAHTPPPPPHTPSHGVQRPLPLVGVQGAKPPGGVRGGAPTFLSFPRLPCGPSGTGGRCCVGRRRLGF